MTETTNGASSALHKLKQHPLILLLVVLLLAGAGYTSYWLFQKTVTTSQKKQATEHARQLATKLRITTNHYLKERNQQLLSLAEKSLFTTAAASADMSQILSMEKLLLEWAPELTAGYLITPGDLRLIEQHNFAGHYLSEKTLAGDLPPVAAARLGKEWQLLYSYPLKDQQGDIIGAMLGIESLQPLLDALKPTVKENLGLTQLIQTLPKTKGATFVTTGNKSKALETVDLKLEPANWSLRYTGSKVLLQSTEPSYEGFALFGSVLAVSTLVIIYLLLRLTLHFHVDKAPSPRTAKKIRLDTPTDPVNADGESFLEVIPGKGAAPKQQEASPEATDTFPEMVFRDYDIRGIARNQLTSQFAQQLGKALAQRAMALGEHTLILGRDGRQTSKQLSEALEQGILSIGCNVIHLGLVPTPLLNFATHHLQQSDCGVMVTASHNPAEYNGFKMFFQHHAMCGEEVKSLRQEMSGEFQEKTPGERSEQDISEDYLQAIIGDIVPAQGLKVILDAGNGAAGELAIRLLEGIGCDVLPLYCDVDGTFPNHPPDPSVPANLEDLRLWVKEQNADLGIALDGDGDRIVAISASGQIIWPDELLMIFARDVVSRHPGADVVFDIKSTRRLNSLISSYGGRPVMWKTGHSHMYNKIIESKAPLGGEFSGHIFFHDRWHGFDDGLYAAARLIEIMSIREQGLDDIMASFETRYATPEILVPTDEESKFDIVQKLLAKEVFQDGKVSTIDGLRVEFPKAWGLVRASNTSPALTLRFEADSRDALEKIQSLFREQLRSIDSNLTF